MDMKNMVMLTTKSGTNSYLVEALSSNPVSQKLAGYELWESLSFVVTLISQFANAVIPKFCLELKARDSITKLYMSSDRGQKMLKNFFRQVEKVGAKRLQYLEDERGRELRENHERKWAQENLNDQVEALKKLIF